MGNQNQDQKDLFATEPEELHPAIRFLLDSKALSFAEVKKLARQSPGIDCARGIFPVRLTVPSYPRDAISYGMFESVQEFILEAVFKTGAPFLVPCDLVLMAGYMLVVGQNEVTAEFIRSLFPELMKAGVCLKEPTREEIKQYYSKLFERNAQKNSFNN